MANGPVKGTRSRNPLNPHVPLTHGKPLIPAVPGQASDPAADTALRNASQRAVSPRRGSMGSVDRSISTVTRISGGGGGDSAPASGVTFAFDLIGDNTGQTVVGIQGIAVTANSPEDGEVLTYSAALDELVYVAPTGGTGASTAPTVPAGYAPGNVFFTAAQIAQIGLGPYPLPADFVGIIGAFTDGGYQPKSSYAVDASPSLTFTSAMTTAMLAEVEDGLSIDYSRKIAQPNTVTDEYDAADIAMYAGGSFPTSQPIVAPVGMFTDAGYQRPATYTPAAQSFEFTPQTDLSRVQWIDFTYITSST